MLQDTARHAVAEAIGAFILTPIGAEAAVAALLYRCLFVGRAETEATPATG